VETTIQEFPTFQLMELSIFNNRSVGFFGFFPFVSHFQPTIALWGFSSFPLSKVELLEIQQNQKQKAEANNIEVMENPRSRNRFLQIVFFHHQLCHGHSVQENVLLCCWIWLFQLDSSAWNLWLWFEKLIVLHHGTKLKRGKNWTTCRFDPCILRVFWTRVYGFPDFRFWNSSAASSGFAIHAA